MRFLHYGFIKPGCPFLWDEHRNVVDAREAGVPPRIRQYIDGGFLPGSRIIYGRIALPPVEQRLPGVVRTEYVEGWSVFGMWDTTIDRRENSHSTFLVSRVIQFDTFQKLLWIKYPDHARRLPIVLKQSGD